MPIYLDLIWMLNFGLDTILLMLCAVVLKRNYKWWRLLLGGFIGSLIVLLMFTPFSHLMVHPAIKILFSFFMVLMTFGYKRLRFFFENLLTFYFATFVVGGGLMGVHFLFQDQFLVLNQMVDTKSPQFGDPISWIFVLIGFPLLSYFSKTRVDDLRMKNITFDQLVDVEIILNEQTLSMKGLIDSGNQLVDPLTKTPVMIVTADSLKEILPEGLMELSKNVQSFSHSEDIDQEWYSKVRFVPYRSVGQAKQLLLALKPDMVRLVHQSNTIEVTKVLVGISHTTLSVEKQYECIVHPKLIVIGEVSSAS
ncbi:sigma-E processing peptidase SpoIIGA [Priestia megaterium]|uniref:sigma-E processing peptidase SpoIIGA n=1 Tax=Priestia megaterium TaxID=1404 RepID=UPI00389ADC71